MALFENVIFPARDEDHAEEMEEMGEIINEDGLAMEIPPHQLTTAELQEALFTGLIEWSLFKWLSTEGLRLQTPFSLQYLALKAWFNSKYWDDKKYNYFRSQTFWDRMTYRLEPTYGFELHLPLIHCIGNVSMANAIQTHRQSLEVELTEAAAHLPKPLQQIFAWRRVGRVMLRNNPVSDVLFSLNFMEEEDEEERHGYYTYLPQSEFDNVEYILSQNRIIFK